ncbi:MAG: sensor histidine kinase [Burkholderiales bacterium]|nr:sensor histidine kinase [Burkholderiales bacterium]
MSQPAAELPVAARGSLQVRLLAGTLVGIAALIVVAGWGLSALFRDHVATQFRAELKTHLDQLAAHLVLDTSGRPSVAAPLSDPRLSRPYSGLYWQVDRVAAPEAPAALGVLRSRSLWDSVLEVPVTAPADGEVHPHSVAGPQGVALGAIERVVRFHDAPASSSRTFRLIVAADERLMLAPMERFSGMLWLALAVLGLGLMIVAIIQVLVGLAPLRRLRVALGAVRAGTAKQLAGDFPLEVAPLVGEFNAVLAQNADIVARARTQSGNLAHALKTPLSVLSNAVVGREDELARLIADQVGTVKRQVDYHLSRARAAAAAQVPGVSTPVLPVLEGLARVMRRVHAERRLELVVRRPAAPPVFRGEAQDLHEMLGNLLDNACKWAARRVEVQVAPVRETVVITLDDDGKGIAPEQRNTVLRRGARADEQVPGSGLGLAIADDLARSYGGEIELADSPLGGLRVTLTLPAAAGPVRR